MEVYHKNPRTRATTWVPRRVFYVLRFLQKALTAGKPKAISNKQIQTAIRFGSEGEVSQIMRWLSGESPTMGRWAYGALNTNPQQYRFIERERMPSGGYVITLLATPEPIAIPAPTLPEIVQLSFLHDPAMIPHAPQPNASQGGSCSHDPFDDVDPPRATAANRRSTGDQHEERSHESNSSSVGARVQKYDWSAVTIAPGSFLPILALERAGVTPQIFQDAERKIATRCEYDHPAQFRILIRSLVTQQPIYSAAEIAARSEETHHDAAAASTGRDGAGARRRSGADPRTRHADHAPLPDAGRDAEYAKMCAEFERIGAALPRGVSRL